jgi:hypothetical protein
MRGCITVRVWFGSVARNGFERGAQIWMCARIWENEQSSRLVGWACQNGLPRISEFEFGCTGFDGLGLDGLGLVVAYTKHVHCK